MHFWLGAGLSCMCLSRQLHAGWTARSPEKPGRSPWLSTASRSSTCRLTSPAANTSPASSRSDPRTKTRRRQTCQYTHVCFQCSQRASTCSKPSQQVCEVHVTSWNTWKTKISVVFRLKRNETFVESRELARGVASGRRPFVASSPNLPNF